jgi:microcystin-dependent protein
LPLETATYTNDLVTSNPAHTDGLSQADSHMRLLKSTIKATFPNFTSAALNSTQAALDAAATAAAGTTASRIPVGTAALPGLTPLGNTNTGLYQPATNQLGVSLNGALGVTFAPAGTTFAAPITATAVASTGAYSGGTGQLVPIGAVLEWYDDTLPAEGGYCWANGQIIASASTVCPVLLARWGNRFGGNGVTTMGVPDRRDTVGVGKSTMGGVSGRGLIAGLTSWVNTTLGNLIGISYNILNISNLPPITSSGVNAISVGPAGTNLASANSGISSQPSPSTGGNSVPWTAGVWAALSAIFTGANTITVTSTGTTNASVQNVQPSTTCNYILRLA